MPSEIILPAGTEFVETANIPVLIAEALNPKPANEPRLGRQTESDSAEVKSAAFRRYQVEREHGAMMCCAIDDGKLKALSSSSRRRVTVHEPDSIVMVSELAKYVEQFGISVNVTDKTKAAYRQAAYVQAAYVQAAYDETGLNGNAINWRYWVHQLPVISAAQAACLMSALEPDLFANLDGRNWQDNPARIDPARNIEKARKIQRLAEAQGKLTASPVEWVGWAQAQSLEVHTGFLLAVEEWLETTSVQGDAAAAAKGKAAQGTNPSGGEHNNNDGDWTIKAKHIAQRLGEEQVKNTGARQVSGHSICEAVADELAKDASTHGTQGPRGANSVRTVGLEGWKFCPPKTEKKVD
jgi:hypothetical protein